MILRSAALASIIIGLIVAACGGSSTGMLVTATAGMPTSSPGARTVDFSQAPAVIAQLAKCPSTCRIGAIRYEDLTGDGREDAVVPILGLSGMGRRPVTAVLVYGFVDATLRQLLFVEDSGLASPGGFNGPLWPYVNQGQVAIGDTLFRAGEALCCPSEADLTVYRWNGTALVHESRGDVRCGSSHTVFGEIFCPRY